MMKKLILAVTFVSLLLLAAHQHDAVPDGIEPPSGDHGYFISAYSIASIAIPPDVNIEPGVFHQNTFDYTEKHVMLSSSSGKNVTTGVRFNVETVPDALPEHAMHKPVLSRKDVLDKLRSDVASYYCRQRLAEVEVVPRPGRGYPKKQRGKYCKKLRPKDIRIEAVSNYADDNDGMNLVYTGGNAFLVASVMAFAQHLPLQLSPDHIWSLITYALAKHVDANAEALRSAFVQHEGKKRIVVDTRDGFQQSRSGDPDSGASPQEWEQTVFAKFSQEINEAIGEDTHALITANFSTTNPASRAASEIVLMSTVKNYFSFGMTTSCGIPNITLLGTEEDWLALRKRTEALGRLMLPEFSSYWMPLVLCILDEFLESYRGNVNHGFWQSMVKLRDTGPGSGSHDFISGWMQILFPYLASGMNKELRPWNEMYFTGPLPEQFPSIISSVSVDWNYYGTIFNMDFHAGITGVSQDPSDGSLSPVDGWHVTHSPPKPAAERLKEITREIQDLLAGHKEEVEVGGDETQPWFQRVSILQSEQAELQKAMAQNSTVSNMIVVQ